MEDATGFWFFQIPNLILAAALYTVLGRFILSLVFAESDQRVLVAVFRQITAPIVAPVQAITPHIVPFRVVLLFTAVWLLAARILFYVVMRMYGLAPGISP